MYDFNKENPLNPDAATAMRPLKSILDDSFNYIPSTATSVDATWRRYGWKPVTEQDRLNRRHAHVATDDTRVVDLKVVRSA